MDEAGLFKDTLVGDPASATYDDLNYPILVSNYGAVEDRWKLKFTGSESFECHSEQRGLIGTGNINADFSPINPMNGQPYLTIYAAGFGAASVVPSAAFPASDRRLAYPSLLDATTSRLFQLKARTGETRFDDLAAA